MELGFTYSRKEVDMIYILFLFFIFLNTAIIRQNNLFVGFYNFLRKYISSNKLLVFLISLVSGVLPVSGRVSVSASMLDTLHLRNKEKLGVLDYLSTHHYYLWSPIEKTIIIPMAVLGLTYFQVIELLLPAIITYLGFLAYYFLFQIKSVDVEFGVGTENSEFSLFTILLFILPIVSMVVFPNVPIWIPFALASPYFLYQHYQRNDTLRNIEVNWSLLFLISGIILFGQYAASYFDVMQEYVKENEFTLPLAVSFGFAISFLLGSSGKFVALSTVLTVLYGIEYFPLFFLSEYAAYLISPTHKCLTIGKQYFGTPFRLYMKPIGQLALIMFVLAIIAR